MSRRRRKPKPSPARRAPVATLRRGSIETHVVVRTKQGPIRVARAVWEARQ